MSQIVLTLKGNLVGLRVHGQSHFHFLPIGRSCRDFFQQLPISFRFGFVEHAQRVSVSGPFRIRVPETKQRSVNRVQSHDGSDKSRHVTLCLTGSVTQVSAAVTKKHSRRILKIRSSTLGLPSSAPHNSFLNPITILGGKVSALKAISKGDGLSFYAAIHPDKRH